MELTKEQIQEVEKYLNAKGVDYLDVKVEVLDHMLTDIESILKNTNSDFEKALQKVCNKWNNHLTESSSFYFGVGFSAPRIIIKKAKDKFKYHYFFLLASYFVPFIVFELFDIRIFENNKLVFNYTLQSFVFLSALYMVFIQIKIFKSRKTTHGFIIKTQLLSVLLPMIFLLKRNYFLEDGTLNGILIGLSICFFYSVYISHRFYLRHKEVILKYVNI